LADTVVEECMRDFGGQIDEAWSALTPGDIFKKSHLLHQATLGHIMPEAEDISSNRFMLPILRVVACKVLRKHRLPQRLRRPSASV
jgi:hypothetical protein